MRRFKCIMYFLVKYFALSWIKIILDLDKFQMYENMFRKMMNIKKNE